MSMNPDDFFNTGGGEYAPPWWTGQAGNLIQGTIVNDPEVMDQTDFDTGQPIYEERNGQRVLDPVTGQPTVKKQLKVILQTQMRNWEGIKNTPVDPDTKQPRPPHEDDGRRAVYVRGWMQGAVGDAVEQATGRRGAPKKGGKLAVRVTELAQSRKPGGNPFPKFEARYEPPNPGDAMFAEQAPAQQQQGQFGPPQAPPRRQAWGARQAPAAPQAPSQRQAWGAPQAPAAPQQQAAPQAPAQAWGPPQQQAAPQQATPSPWEAPPAPAQPGSPWEGQGFGDQPNF